MGFEGTLVGDERRFVETPDMGLMVSVQRTRGMTQAGVPITTDIRASTIFRKEAGHWPVVHHHTDRFQARGFCPEPLGATSVRTRQRQSPDRNARNPGWTSRARPVQQPA